MSIRYIPLLPWQPCARPEWSSGGFNFDRASVLWRGPAPTKDAFLAGLERQQWGSLPAYSFQGNPAWTAYGNMWLETWQDGNGTPSWPGIELVYVGFRDGALPDPSYQDCTSQQTVNASGMFDGDTISGTFTYIASRTNWEWFQTTQPTRRSPQYAYVHAPLDPLESIIGYSLRNSSGTPVNTLSTGQVGAAFNDLSRTIQVTSDFKVLVPGKLWQCSSTADYILVGL